MALHLIVSLAPGRAAQSVTLSWDAAADPNITGYKLHYGTTGGRPDTTIDVGNRTTASVSNLNDATTYFFSVTAYNALAVESLPSQEISYETTAPAAAAVSKRTLTVNNGSGRPIRARHAGPGKRPSHIGREAVCKMAGRCHDTGKPIPIHDDGDGALHRSYDHRKLPPR